MKDIRRIKNVVIVSMIILTMAFTGCARQVSETATEEYRTIPTYITYVSVIKGKIRMVPIMYKERKYIVTYSDGTTKEVWRNSNE